MTARRKSAAVHDPAVSLFDDEDMASTNDSHADTSATLSPAQKLLVYCDATGIAVRPARTAGKVTVALYPLPPTFRAALDECEGALRALVETIQGVAGGVAAGADAARCLQRSGSRIAAGSAREGRTHDRCR